MMGKLLKLVAALAVLPAAAYYPLVLHSPSPSAEHAYDLDMGAIRALASQGRGPDSVSVEKVAEMRFAQAMTMVGEPWRWTPMPVYVFRLNYPQGSIIVDTAMANTDGIPDSFVTSMDSDAVARMNAAMLQADQIVITHEHFDHIGGILQHPDLDALIPKLRLTPEQLAHEDRMQPLSLPDGVFDDYEPLDYEGTQAITPGVVLIKAPGHTPGSQMVFIRLADGRELLLLGDVSWKERNLHAVKERPLFITAIVKENRTQVINQFQALHELMKAEPGLHILPGHDGEATDALLEKGVLQAGF